MMVKIMIKIAIIGSPGTGKSTLAYEIMTFFKKRGLHIEMVPELIKYKVFDKKTNFFAKNFDINNTKKQKELEYIFKSEVAQKEIDYLLCEAPLCNGFFYASFYKKEAELKKLHKIALNSINDYDIVFFVKRLKNQEFISFGRKESISQAEAMELLIEKEFNSLYFKNVYHVINRETDINFIFNEIIKLNK